MKTPSIQETIGNFVRAFEGNHYSKSFLQNVRFTSAQIIRLHEEKGFTTVNLEILKQFKHEKRKGFESGKFGRSMLYTYLSIASRLETFITTNSIAAKRPTSGNDLAEYYKNILSEIRSVRFGAESIQPQVVSCAYQFFKWLLENKCQDLSKVKHDTMRQYMLFLSKRLNGHSLRRVQRHLMILNRHFLAKGYTTEVLEKILSLPIAVEKKVLPAMDIGELSLILDHINRDTTMGKRSYAIMLLGAVTGLRAGDIAALRFSEINWQTGTIHIVQSKTMKPLVLPLTSDVGNALQDYILNGRPQIKSERIFLNNVAPYSIIRSGTVIATLSKCKTATGLSPYGGFHSLRRAVGRNMSIAGIPVTTIAQILGHTGLNSTKQYICLDSVHLKVCALGFYGIEPKKMCLQHKELKSCALDFAYIRPLKEVCL